MCLSAPARQFELSELLKQRMSAIDMLLELPSDLQQHKPDCPPPHIALQDEAEWWRQRISELSKPAEPSEPREDKEVSPRDGAWEAPKKILVKRAKLRSRWTSACSCATRTQAEGQLFYLVVFTIALSNHDVSFVFSMKIQPVRFRKSNSASRQPSIPPQPPGTGTAMCLLAIVQASRRLHRETNLRDTSLNRCLRVNAPSLNELIQNYQLKLPA